MRASFSSVAARQDPRCSARAREVSFGDLRRWLGQRGLIAIERLMGMVPVTVTIQLLMTGVAAFVAS